MKLQMLKGEENTKLVYTAKVNRCTIRSFSLPWLITCLRAGTDPDTGCIHHCFASCGQQAYKNVVEHYTINYLKSLHPSFVNAFSQELEYLIKKHGNDIAIRLHACGDVYSVEYLYKLRAIAARFPSVFFYGYTKSWQLVENNGGLVSRNLVLIPSEGGKDDHFLGTRPRAYVFPTKGKPRPGTVEGSKDDLENVRQYLGGKSIGLRAHGAKKGNVK